MLLRIIKERLLEIIQDIDAGNSELSEEDALELIDVLKEFTDKSKPLTKYQACKQMGVSRATFDRLVAEGKIPKGKKLYAGDSNIFWFKKDLIHYE